MSPMSQEEQDYVNRNLARLHLASMLCKMQVEAPIAGEMAANIEDIFVSDTPPTHRALVVYSTRVEDEWE